MIGKYFPTVVYDEKIVFNVINQHSYFCLLIQTLERYKHTYNTGIKSIKIYTLIMFIKKR